MRELLIWPKARTIAPREVEAYLREFRPRNADKDFVFAHAPAPRPEATTGGRGAICHRTVIGAPPPAALQHRLYRGARRIIRSRWMIGV